MSEEKHPTSETGTDKLVEAPLINPPHGGTAPVVPQGHEHAPRHDDDATTDPSTLSPDSPVSGSAG